VRSANARAGRGKGVALDDDVGARRGLFQALGWSARDAVGLTIGALATTAILINVLFMQKGSHPAPMFKSAPAAGKPVATASVPAQAARPRPTEPAAAPRPADLAQTKVAAPPAPAASPAPRMPGEIINDIQRELVRRGYYEGAVDGFYGPRTDSAIRDFEQAAGLKPSTEPNEALLQAIVRAPARLAKVATGTTPVPRPPAPIRNEPLSEKPVPEKAAPSKRLIALQRALADYGYGQIKPSGIMNAETQAAIEKFERERKLPVTGQASDRVVRELSSMTGRPLD
jgi:peptidoglycan hydrolase-like protein with peptidoglycan-binding domain